MKNDILPNTYEWIVWKILNKKIFKKKNQLICSNI